MCGAQKSSKCLEYTIVFNTLLFCTCNVLHLVQNLLVGCMPDEHWLTYLINSLNIWKN